MGTGRVGSRGAEALGVGSFGVDGAMRARIAHDRLGYVWLSKLRAQRYCKKKGSKVYGCIMLHIMLQI